MANDINQTDFPPGKCVRLTYVENIKTRKSYCTACVRETSALEDHIPIQKHYAVKGEYKLQCVACNKNLAIERSLDDCILCYCQSSAIANELRYRNIDVNKVSFRINSCTTVIEEIRIKPNLFRTWIIHIIILSLIIVIFIIACLLIYRVFPG